MIYTPWPWVFGILAVAYLLWLRYEVRHAPTLIELRPGMTLEDAIGTIVATSCGKEHYRPFSIPMVHWLAGAPVYADGVAEWWTPRFGIEAERLGRYDAERMHTYLMAIEPSLPKLVHQGSRKA